MVAAIATRLWPSDIIFGDANLPLGTLIDGIQVEVSSLRELNDHHVIVTVGANLARRSLQNDAEALGLSCPNLIADTAHYFSAAPGAGSMILTSAIVHPGARIGRGVIVNTAAVVEHDCVIGDFCHLAPNSTVLGNCRLSNDIWLGANATVLPGSPFAQRLS